jgi:integrase/recombinase XerD
VKSPKARLYIRVRRPDGKKPYLDPVWSRNRTLRQGYALVDGKPEAYPSGCYYLRFLRNGKRVWVSVGPDADAALAAFRNKEHDLKAVALGRVAPDPLEGPVTSLIAEANGSPSVSLDAAVADYLDEIRRFRSYKTIMACQQMLKLFRERLPGTLLRDITRKDLLDHMSALKESGKGDRTVYNHIMRVITFLKANGIVGLLKSADKPTYDEKDVDAYDADQLGSLFAAASAEERTTFEFFLSTGLRDREVMYTTWKNIDFKGKVVKVRSKPEMGFKIKDKEERSVPVPDALIDSLAERRKRSTSMLVFPGRTGNPNGHFLRTLQNLAFRAGLNCGECITKSGNGCGDHPVCGEWTLHKFRRTFATFHSESGISPRTIQAWLGHSELATSLRYLTAANLRSERTRGQVNATFAALNMGGAA